MGGEEKHLLGGGETLVGEEIDVVAYADGERQLSLQVKQTNDKVRLQGIAIGQTGGSHEAADSELSCETNIGVCRNIQIFVNVSNFVLQLCYNYSLNVAT